MTATYATRQQAAAAVHELHDAGHAATLYGSGGTFAAIDLDGPVVDATDVLLELGLDLETAEDVALRLVARGY